MMEITNNTVNGLTTRAIPVDWFVNTGSYNEIVDTTLAASIAWSATLGTGASYTVNSTSNYSELYVATQYSTTSGTGSMQLINAIPFSFACEVQASNSRVTGGGSPNESTGQILYVGNDSDGWTTIFSMSNGSGTSTGAEGQMDVRYQLTCRLRQDGTWNVLLNTEVISANLSLPDGIKLKVTNQTNSSGAGNQAYARLRIHNLRRIL